MELKDIKSPNDFMMYLEQNFSLDGVFGTLSCCWETV